MRGYTDLILHPCHWPYVANVAILCFLEPLVDPNSLLTDVELYFLQLSLLDCSDGTSVKTLAIDKTAAELDALFEAKRLDIPHLLKAKIQGTGISAYNNNQLIIPFDPDDSQREGRWVRLFLPM